MLRYCLCCLMTFHFFNHLQCSLSNRSTPSTSDSCPTASCKEYESWTKSQDTSEETHCKHIYILHLYGSLLFPAAVGALIWVTCKEHWNIRWYFADTILFINSAINPFLYFWRNREVWEAVLKVVRKRLCKIDEENLDNGDQWNSICGSFAFLF